MKPEIPAGPLPLAIRRVARRPRCTATAVIDFDSVDCVRPADHEGMHVCEGDGGRIHWRPVVERVGA